MSQTHRYTTIATLVAHIGRERAQLEAVRAHSPDDEVAQAYCVGKIHGLMEAKCAAQRVSTERRYGNG